MDTDIKTAIQRVRGYWFVDGFTEMAAGGVFILLAALLRFSGNASPATFSTWLLSMAGEIAIAKFAGGLAAILILWWLKDHFTYPRTGFVRGQRITAAQISMILRSIALFLFLPILGLLGAGLLLTSSDSILAAMPAGFPVGLGIVWAALFLLSGEWMGIARFRILGGLTLLAGIAIGAWQLAAGLPGLSPNAQSGLPPALVVESINRTLVNLGFLTLICGVGLLFSGLVAFIQYRKENPSPYAEGA
jgi:hypothetical protein